MDTAFIEKRMTELGLCTKTFAEKCLVAVEYMKQVLRGYRPSKRLIAKMAEVLGCALEKICPQLEIKSAV